MLKFIMLFLVPVVASAAEPITIVYMPQPPAYIFKCTEKTCTPYQMQIKKSFEDANKGLTNTKK